MGCDLHELSSYYVVSVNLCRFSSPLVLAQVICFQKM